MKGYPVMRLAVGKRRNSGILQRRVPVDQVGKEDFRRGTFLALKGLDRLPALE